MLYILQTPAISECPLLIVQVEKKIPAKPHSRSQPAGNYRMGAARFTIGRLMGGLAILGSLLVFGESWYTLFVFEVVVIYVCSEILVDHVCQQRRRDKNQQQRNPDIPAKFLDGKPFLFSRRVDQLPSCRMQLRFIAAQIAAGRRLTRISLKT